MQEQTAGGGKCRSDKVWKAIRRKYSKVPDEIWLSWLSCLLVAKRNSQASRPNVAVFGNNRFRMLVPLRK